MNARRPRPLSRPRFRRERSRDDLRAAMGEDGMWQFVHKDGTPFQRKPSAQAARRFES